ncbi:BamA/TamA family outer membrane protein [candidate division KSB1 bacterium]|nr:BamA/TamA family outer membrane protein [candidate division KSB1 bacterium]
MRFNFLIICFLLVGSVEAAWTQSDIGGVLTGAVSTRIAKILVSGNRFTKTQVILREMQTEVGDTVDVGILQEDQKRIYNLGLFNRVEIDSLQQPEGVHLLVGVSEYPLYPFYVRPFLILHRNDNDWKKLSYGLGIAHLNFRGRNEKAIISAWAGYDPGVALDYSNPWLFGSTQLLTGFRFAIQRVRDLSFANIDSIVDQRRIGGSWSLGRRFGLFTYLSFNVGYTELKFNPAVKEALEPLNHEHLPSAGLTFIYDKRDLFEYPRSGVFAKLWAQRTGFNSQHVHFWRYGADLRGYKKIYRGLSLGARVMTNLAQEEIPFYERVFLGYSTRVRGHFNRNENDAIQSPAGAPLANKTTLLKDEGENLIFSSIELRFPILPLRYFSVNDGSALGGYLQNLKFGLSAGIFFDYGRVWFQKSPLDRPRHVLPPQLGYGAGLHIHLPYINLLRLELAFDEEGRSERIVDIGVAF